VDAHRDTLRQPHPGEDRVDVGNPLPVGNPASSSSESVSAVNRRALPEEPRGFAAAGLVWIDARTLETRANWVLPSNRLGLSALPLGIWVGCLSQLSVNQRISPTKRDRALLGRELNALGHRVKQIEKISLA
jgi:hypothetical protein